MINFYIHLDSGKVIKRQGVGACTLQVTAIYKQVFISVHRRKIQRIRWNL